MKLRKIYKKTPVTLRVTASQSVLFLHCSSCSGLFWHNTACCDLLRFVPRRFVFSKLQLIQFFDFQIYENQKQPPEVFRKKDVLRNFTIFIGKHLCQSFFFNKVEGLRPLLKKRLWHSCFPVNLVKFPRTPFFIEPLWWLLL